MESLPREQILNELQQNLPTYIEQFDLDSKIGRASCRERVCEAV